MATFTQATSSLLTTVVTSTNAVTKAVDTAVAGIDIVHAHANKARTITLSTIADETPLAINRKRIELVRNHVQFMNSVNEELGLPKDEDLFKKTLNTLTGKEEKE